MGRAVNELDRRAPTGALPHEMEALNQLLKADAENAAPPGDARRSRRAAAAARTASEADLSSLFDQELRKRQQTNYETPNSTEERQENKQDDLLERIRELARRQDALNRQQRELARNREQLEEEELKRQLERLTREQNELRQQAEQLRAAHAAAATRQRSAERRVEQAKSGQSGQQQAGSAGQPQQLREISEDMRNAATGLRRQDSQQASRERHRARRSGCASSSGRCRRRSPTIAGARSATCSSRRASSPTRSAAWPTKRSAPRKGQSGDDARRRLAGEQERLAEPCRSPAGTGQADVARAAQGKPDERKATEDAARELERQKLAERMRQSADALRQASARSEQARTGARRDASGRAPGRGRGARAGSHCRSPRRRRRRAGSRFAPPVRSAVEDAGAARQGRRPRALDRRVAARERRRRRARIRTATRAVRSRRSRQPAGSNGEQQAARQGPQQAQGSQGGQQQGRPAGVSRRAATAPAVSRAAATGGNGGRVQQLQREVNERMRDAERLADEIRRENPGMQGPNPDEGWWRSFSAPGHRGVQAGLRALGIAEAKSAGRARRRRDQGVD